MRKSVIISIVYPPTTPAFSHPSFPKEGNGDTSHSEKTIRKERKERKETIETTEETEATKK